MQKSVSAFIKIILELILVAIFFIPYLAIDKELYYYGQSRYSFKWYNELPFGIKPQYWGYDMGQLGFVLQSDDQTLIAKGNRYFSRPDVEIAYLLSYGFSKDLVVSKVKATDSLLYYVVATSEKKSNPINTDDCSMDVIDADKYDTALHKDLKWINLIDNNAHQLKEIQISIRYAILILYICLAVTLWKAFKQLRYSQNKKTFHSNDD